MQFKIVLAAAFIASVAAVPTLNDLLDNITAPDAGVGNGNAVSAATGPISAALGAITANDNGIANGNTIPVTGNTV